LLQPPLADSIRDTPEIALVPSKDWKAATPLLLNHLATYAAGASMSVWTVTVSNGASRSLGGRGI
jgi:hypothetical protein